MVLFLFGLGLFSEAQKHLKSQKLSEHRSYLNILFQKFLKKNIFDISLKTFARKIFMSVFKDTSGYQIYFLLVFHVLLPVEVNSLPFPKIRYLLYA